MSMSISGVRSALAAVAATAPGVTATPYVPDSVSVPHFFTAEYDVEFDKAMGRGMDSVSLTCRILTSRADDLTGQVSLDNLIMTMKATLEGARGNGLGGTSLAASGAVAGPCDDFVVRRAQAMRMYDHDGIHYYGVDLIIDIIG